MPDHRPSRAEDRRTPPPLGVVLAGGLGRRIGGAKATVELAGRPLIAYPVAALGAILPEVVILAKRDTELPALEGVVVWIEPDTPRHPLAGVAHALERAGGRAVLACAGDMPLITGELVSRLAGWGGYAPAVVPRHPDGIEPLLALYRPVALSALHAAAREGVPARATVSDLGPDWIELPDAGPLFSVNRPEDLVRAAAGLSRR